MKSNTGGPSDAGSPPRQPPPPTAKTLRVLVLEDSPLDAELLVGELERWGFAPLWTRVDTEADYLAHLAPSLDVILADHALPGFGGLRAMHLLRERSFDVPVIVVSGNPSADAAMEAFAAGVSHYVRKDHLSCLGPAVERALVGRRVRDEHVERLQACLRTAEVRLQQTREEERARLARDLHDELGQALAGLKLDLAWLARRLCNADADDDTRERLAQMLEQVDTTIAALHHVAGGLRPAVLDDLGLAAAITWLARRIARRDGITCTMNVEPPLAPPRDIALALFRIAQEALANVTRHARARRVHVSLGERGDRLVLEVADDGCGIGEAEAAAPGALGLLGMRERAELLGGELRIHGTPDRGTTLTASIPLLAASPRARDPGFDGESG